MLPIRRLLLRDLLVLMAGVCALLLGLAWWSQQQALDRQADARVQMSLRQLDQALRTDLQASQSLGRLIQHWWLEGLLDPERPEPTAHLVTPMLAAQHSITSLNLARADGRSMLFLRLGSTWSFRELADPGPRARIRWRQLDPDGRVVSEDPWTFMDYDPRVRPWYAAAAAAPEATWTEPYTFYTTQDPGITFALPVRDAAGLRGVAALDFLLDDLTARVWAAQPTPLSRCLVLDAQGRALILPHTPAYETPETRRNAFLNQTEATSLGLQAANLEDDASGGLPRPLSLGGKPAIGLFRSLGGLPGLPWRMALAVPTEDLLGPTRFRAGAMLGLALLCLVLASWRIQQIASRVVEPIAELSTIAENLGQGAVPPEIPSDILEIRSLHRALLQAQESLAGQARLQRQLEHSQRMETVGTLAGGIAHDVNNQLATILGQLNLSRELLSEGHPVVNRLIRAEEATKRCAQTTKALLSFSRQAQPELRRLDLNGLVGETADILDRVLGGRIRLSLELAPDLPAIAGDAVQLEQVLMNLAVNARDAMPGGGSLDLRTFRDGQGQVCLEVRDSGTGIPEDLLPHIFEPFVTTKDLGKGTGLGLAMVFGIVRAHRGKVHAENAPGGGARFLVSLPPARSEDSGEVRAHRDTRTQGPALAGLRVLVVEDETLLRDMLAEALTLARVQVTAAPDGGVAWRAWQAGTFDLVLSDHRMPDCTGLELLGRIRTAGSKVPFILISGQGLEGMEASLAQDPQARVLPKPFELPKLMELMSSLQARPESAELSVFPNPQQHRP